MLCPRSPRILCPHHPWYAPMNWTTSLRLVLKRHSRTAHIIASVPEQWKDTCAERQRRRGWAGELGVVFTGRVEWVGSLAGREAGGGEGGWERFYNGRSILGRSDSGSSFRPRAQKRPRRIFWGQTGEGTASGGLEAHLFLTSSAFSHLIQPKAVASAYFYLSLTLARLCFILAPRLLWASVAVCVALAGKDRVAILFLTCSFLAPHRAPRHRASC